MSDEKIEQNNQPATAIWGQTANPNDDASRATEQPQNEADKQAQAEAGAEAAKLPDDKSNSGGPELGREWSDAQKANNADAGSTSDEESQKIADKSPAFQKSMTKQDMGYYRGPTAGNLSNDVDMNTHMNALRGRVFDNKGKKNETQVERNRANIAKSAAEVRAISPKPTESANAHNPTADADGPNKVAPGQSIADTWQANR